MATVNRFRMGVIVIRPGEKGAWVQGPVPRDVVVIVDYVPSANQARPLVDFALDATWNTGHWIGVGVSQERRYGMRLVNNGNFIAAAQLYMSQISGE